ncbi:GNAT family N-acetyltransferase [Fulvivirgaceae bacterium BMA10]|uniref:GNAT family N-acetyltransferase n=1 Tax=Splendidivirga corallicola TaxID=3051826 RepID=A0ABT8KIN4_9BACT|nr:GNAT family N-acetyltransferase [Fulvivirgaceae bacterium BMA10]
MNRLEIKEGTINDVVSLSQLIPEFQDPHGIKIYQERLSNVPYLVLMAYFDGAPAGFKVGYQREDNGSFYSWMGAVHPDYRKLGIARKLADYQENWARRMGYQTIKMKTRNRLKPMLLFALSNGFNIVAVERKEDIREHRIILEKSLH